MAFLPGRMNLGSVHKTAQAPDSLTSPMTIVNGGTPMEVTAGMRLTPAQALALAQVMQTGSQSIVLGAQGKAIGGVADLTGLSSFTSLHVPRGVSVLDDFAANQSFQLKGDLVNFGAIYTFSTNQAVTNAVISANNISNSVGAVITSVVPVKGIFDSTNVVTNLSLSLIARDSIFNAGTISSAGNLNLVAGNQIVNAVPGSVGQAVLSALGNVNIATQNLTNSGLIQANNNINIVQQVVRNAELAALPAQLLPLDILGPVHDLTVNNTGGVLAAINGSINFDHANATEGTTLSVVGGDLLSSVINADAGSGQLNMAVDKLPGVLNVNAGSAYAGSMSSLTLGRLEVSGDPTFWTSGSLDVSSLGLAPFVGQGVTLLAGMDVDLGNVQVQSRIDGGQGFIINVVAGANLIPPSVTASQLPTGQTVKVTGPSSSGGNILCTACAIDASSAANGLKGGNVLLAAYEDPDSPGTNGTINNAGGTMTIKTSAGGDIGQAGNVTVIAPNNIVLNDVTMNNTTGAAKITVTNAQPKGSLTARSDGSVTGALKAGPVPVNAGGSIDLKGKVIAPGATATMSTRSNLQMFAGSQIDVSGNISGRAGGKVILKANDVTPLSVKANGFAGADGVDGGAGGRGGNGGVITITALDKLGDVSTTEQLSAIGGAGGAGDKGADGDPSRIAGGSGAQGGAGGLGGTVTLTAGGLGDVNATDVHGGAGGHGGSAGIGVSSPDGSTGGASGGGGKGGVGGKGGKVTFRGAADSVLGFVNAPGGAGGAGLTGGDGAAGDVVGGHGGNGGGGGNGGAGGTDFFTLRGGKITCGGCFVFGGNSGSAGPGGGGGSSSDTGGAGGNGGSGGAGGKGGSVKINGTADVQANFQNALAGDGLAGGAGGAGGPGDVAGGHGGNGGKGGKGGTGGTVALSSSGGKITDGLDYLLGGNSLSGGKGGVGGDSTNGVGGAGGIGGSGSAGAKAGKLTVKAPGDILTNFPDGDGGPGGSGGAGGGGGFGHVVGGAGGNGGKGGTSGASATVLVSSGGNWSGPLVEMEGHPGGSGGAGGTGGNSDNTGGAGGNGGSAATGGKGGKLRAKATGDDLLNGLVNPTGGPGGSGGLGGKGGDGDAVGGGNGGNGGKGGNGGAAGTFFLSVSRVQTFNAIDLVGGNSGPGGGGGEGGISANGKGGAGGNGGSASAGGKGGNLKVNATGDINANVPFTFGGSGAAGGPGGNGGSGFVAGGDGGNGGTGGKGNAGGSIVFSSSGGTITDNVSRVRGGSGGSGGAGGVGGESDTTGGAGGNGGLGSAGAKAGKITLKGPGDISVQILDALGGSGGSSGAGGQGGTGDAVGGAGGNGATGAKGGAGGSILVSSSTGKVTQTTDTTGIEVDASGGAGGTAPGGAGGDSDTHGGAGGNGGPGGAAGKAGKIVMTAATEIDTTGQVSANGGKGGDGGTGGGGGNAPVASGTFGGDGGDHGGGGNGANGGTVTLTAPTVNNAFQPTATGGGAGLGGTGAGGGTGETPGHPGATGDDGKPGKDGKVSYASPENEDGHGSIWKRSKRRDGGRSLIAGARTGGMSDADEASKYTPVSFLHPTLMLTEPGLSAENALLAPERKDIIAEVGPATVRIASGSAAFVVHSGGNVSVLSLHESATGDVTVTVSGQQIALRAGEQVVVTDAAGLSFGDVNPISVVACREVMEHALSNGARAFICQFSVPSALSNLKCLQHLAHSHESRGRALHSKILKNAAILHMVTARKGPYRTWEKTPAKAI